MKLWLLIIKAHPPAHCGWDFSMDWQKEQAQEGVCADQRSEFHLGSVSRGIFVSLRGCPAWFTPTELNRAFLFPPPRVSNHELTSMSQLFPWGRWHPCQLWELPREKPAPGPGSTCILQIDFSCVCVWGSVLHLTTCPRWLFYASKGKQASHLTELKVRRQLADGSWFTPVDTEPQAWKGHIASHSWEPGFGYLESNKGLQHVFS